MRVNDEIYSLTSSLVLFRTIKSRPDELERIIDFIEEYHSADGFSAKRFVQNGKVSLLLLPKGVKNPRILLAAHADVVEAEEEQFLPRLIDGRLYGRGAVDMKGGLAIFMLLLKKHKENSIGLLVTTDEEQGGFDGAGIVAKMVKPDFIIASEPTDLNITVKEKGILWIKLVATGKSCHASRPWLGVNAADVLIEAYLRIKESFPTVPADSWKTTMNLGIINAGVANNIVPGTAEAMLDIRYTEEVPVDELVNRIRKSVEGLSVNVEVVAMEPLLVSKPSYEQKRLESAFEKVIGRKPKLIFEHGASDLRFFSAKGVPCVLFGPKGANYHGRDEYLDVESAVECFNVLDEFLKGC